MSNHGPYSDCCRSIRMLPRVAAARGTDWRKRKSMAVKLLILKEQKQHAGFPDKPHENRGATIS